MVAVVGSYDKQKNTHSILLACCYLIVVGKEDPIYAWNLFSDFHSSVVEFGEKTQGTSVGILDVVCGISKALKNGNYFFYF